MKTRTQSRLALSLLSVLLVVPVLAFSDVGPSAPGKKNVMICNVSYQSDLDQVVITQNFNQYVETRPNGNNELVTTDTFYQISERIDGQVTRAEDFSGSFNAKTPIELSDWLGAYRRTLSKDPETGAWEMSLEDECEQKAGHVSCTEY